MPIGIDKLQQALGISTIPLILPYNFHYSTDPSLHWSTTQQHVNLLSGVSECLQIVYGVQTSVFVVHVWVQVELLPAFIYADALKGQRVGVVWTERSWTEDRILELVFLDPPFTFDDVDLKIQGKIYLPLYGDFINKKINK
jgi:hypothetical protein